MGSKRKILIEKTDKTTCLYFHINPIKQEIFYVGIGDEKRPYTISEQHRTKFWFNIFHKYGYQVIIIEKNLTWEQACKKEIYWIKRIGRRDLNEGTLVNQTDGGDGQYNPSKETREKMSKAKQGMRPYKIKDLTGKKFGRLIILKQSENRNKNNKVLWICNCDCGTKNFETTGRDIVRGDTKSCGCLKHDLKGNCVLQLEKKTNKILSAFKSFTIAKKLTGISVSDYIRGLSKYGGGYDWKIITEDEYDLYKKYNNISIYKYIKYKIIAILPNGNEQKFETLKDAAKFLKRHESRLWKLIKTGKPHKLTGIKFKKI